VIYFHAPDVTHAAGGIRVVYRCADACNAAGLPAAVMHQRRGFRASWFASATRVVAAQDTPVYDNDVLVFSELDAPKLVPVAAPHVAKVVLNQDHFWTFVHGAVDYRHPDIAAVLTVSADAVRYLTYAFPGLSVARIHLAVDPDLFHPERRTRDQTIAFAEHKGANARTQVLRILQQRDSLRGWRLLPLGQLSQRALAARLRSTALFAAFSEAEGFQLLLTEAMASGCPVVGFDAGGGREYLTEDVAWPVPAGDVVRFAERIEEVTRGFLSGSADLARRTDAAVSMVRREYTPDHEAADVVQALRPVVERAARRPPGRGHSLTRLSRRTSGTQMRLRAIVRAALSR
jgi:hypothetical protein